MDETIQTFHRIFSVTGVTMYAKDNWDSKLWLCWQIFNVIIGFFTVVFTTAYVFVNLSDTEACIRGACIWTTGIIMFISFSVCLIFRNKFRQFLNEMGFKDAILEMPLIEYVLKLEQTELLNELKGMVVGSHEKLLKVTRVLLITYVLYAWVCATLFLSDSVYSMIVREDDSLRILAFEMWVPWSLQDINVYLATYVFNAYSGYLCCIAYPALQLTIFLLVGQTVRQLRILNFILLNLDKLAVEITGRRGDLWQQYCTSILLQCVDHYIKLKRFSNKLNVICQPFYLALILDATMMVCVCSVKIAISMLREAIEIQKYSNFNRKDGLSLPPAWVPVVHLIKDQKKSSPETMKYFFQGFCLIMVVLTFCLLGQQVDNECAKLETAVTENWYSFNRTHKIHVRIFNMALSQGMPIFIFGTIPLSAPTFTWFLKTVMSFFTLVMSVLE